MWANIVKAIFGIVGGVMQQKFSKMAYNLQKQNLATRLRMADEQEFAGRLAQKAYEADAAMIEMDASANALSYEKQALDVENEGYEVAASQRMAFIKSGVDMSGSPLLVSRDTIEQAKSESADLQRLAENIRTTGAYKASQSRAQGRMKLWEAEINAGNSRVAAYYDLATAALSAGASAVSTITSWGESTAGSFAQYNNNTGAGNNANVDYTSMYNANYIGITKQNVNYANSQPGLSKLQSLGSDSSVQRSK